MNQITVKNKLESDVSFRERKNKWLGIAELLKDHFNIQASPQRIMDIIAMGSNLDRYWRQTMKENEHLHGQDYNDRERLEQEKVLSLGYHVGHFEDLKKLRTL